MERVLFIMGNMGLGGAETHIMKVYRVINKDQYQFDFILNVPQKCYYEEEINALGGVVYRVTPKSKSIFNNFKEIKNIVQDNNYKIVFKCGEQAMSWTEMLAAKIGGAEKRIMRSTNSKGSSSMLNNLMHFISRVPLRIFTTTKVAPSLLAGEWLFGKKGSKDLVLIKNGIDIRQYAYSNESNFSARAKLNIPMNGTVVGHVGRFNEQKNHDFLIDIFNEYHKKNENSYLLLVGDGPLKSQIQNKVKTLNLQNHVVFTGNREDVYELYSVMDMFVFPSFYEGMPNTVIEAQANGLKCFVSDTITKEANITNNIEYLSLEKLNCWVDAITGNVERRTDVSGCFIRSGYDIDSVMKTYVQLFSS